MRCHYAHTFILCKYIFILCKWILILCKCIFLHYVHWCLYYVNASMQIQRGSYSVYEVYMRCYIYIHEYIINVPTTICREQSTLFARVKPPSASRYLSRVENYRRNTTCTFNPDTMNENKTTFAIIHIFLYVLHTFIIIIIIIIITITTIITKVMTI